MAVALSSALGTLKFLIGGAFVAQGFRLIT